ncbi:hypothetical protein E4K67_23460 [Desulfosporosinus fructosivorans]|uniref:Uncharacterized protein n=1 Tax=Desulfosporosinus fructosivorans TaxID=2018669 RepID=A0A4Z0R166_9FIRM|nr:hypothetical protein [Desulfosporosinus fructosivorans]TGE35727.1 hypothetical protein E4K67_23460 [Desulfosporosinus fructosivorans]
MNGENKNGGIELTDEEMGQVAAGKSLVLMNAATGLHGYRCSCADIRWLDVSSYMMIERIVGVCPKFIKKEEPKEYNHCKSCIYFKDMGIMDEDAIQTHRAKGYGIGTI